MTTFDLRTHYMVSFYTAGMAKLKKKKMVLGT